MQVVLRKFAERARHPNWQGIAREMMAAMQSEVKPLMLGYGERVVANWKNKPHFSAEIKITREAASLSVEPKGPNRELWIWVSRGTGLYGPKKQRYWIRPKGRRRGGADILAFPSLYLPKTSPRGPSYGGPGKSSGPTRFSRGHKHPGIKPRNFEAAWARWGRGPVRRILENAARRGARKA